MPIQTLTVRGTPRDWGNQVGEAFRADIQRVVGGSNASAVLKEKRHLVGHVLGVTEAAAPHVIAELRGLAEGAGVDFVELFTFNCPEIRQVHGGCSTVVVRNRDGTFLLGHNEDGAETQTARDLGLITYQSPGRSVTSLTYLGELAGNAVSWNSDGLIVTVNDLHPVRPFVRRLSRFTVARLLINEPSVETALKLLRGLMGQAASGFHYLLGSTETREVISVESTARTVSVVPVGTHYVHTNHCIHPRLRNQSRPAGLSSSRRRLERLTTLADAPASQALVTTWLGNHDDQTESVYAKEGDLNRTLATVVFDSHAQHVTLYAGGVSDAEPQVVPL